jgi:hypothetical protein
MNPISPILTVRTILPAANAPTTTEGRQYGLQAGQFVHATVAEGGQNSVLLDINQQRLQARTEVPLQTGQQLRLLIEETSPHLQLRLIRDSLVERLTHAVHLLEEKWDLPGLLSRLAETRETGHEALDRLLTFFSGFSPALEESPCGKKLRALVSKMGLTLEAELGRDVSRAEPENLKSALLSARKQLPEQETELSETLDRLQQKIELFQLCNLRLARQEAALIPLPLPFLESGYMIVENGGEGKTAEAGPCKLSLFLGLKKLGDLRIDLLHEGGGLFLRFTCSSRQMADFLAGFEGELRSMLTGLPLYGASYGCGAENFANDLIRRVLADEQDLLNTRV